MGTLKAGQAHRDRFAATAGLMAFALVCLLGLRVAVALAAPALATLARLTPAESTLACVGVLGAALLALARRPA